jgi:hypothetical protein
MKGKLIAAICIVLLFIPTYIAVTFYINAQNSPVSDNVISKMVMRDVDGATFTFTRGSDAAGTSAETSAETSADAQTPGKTDETDMISFFVKMNDKAESVDALPEPLSGTDCYTVTYFSYNLETTYKYYFTADTNDAYLVDNNGEAFHITPDDAGVFISSKYAVSLYKEAAAPVLTLSSSDIVLPQAMTWKYRLTDNAYTDAVVPLSSARDTYSLSGALNLKFNIEPDYFFVKIQNGEKEIFNDLYSNINTADFDENATLTITVNAQWYDIEQRGSYGEALYTFVAEVHAPAEFYLGVPKLEPGGFVAITGKNVDDPAAITFVSDPEINYKPVFYRDGDNVIALVPISYDLEYSPSYKFTITSGGVATELTLGVSEKEFKKRDYDISAEIINATRTDSIIDDFNQAMTPYLNASEPVRYWQPETLFTVPSEGTDLVSTGIGIYRTLTATGTTYRHPGVDFLVTEGMNVLAAFDGKVIYAGTQTMSGRIVVIEHGFGLKSMYCHMSSVTVAEGDMVKAGDILGVVGTTGFTKDTNLHFGLYLFTTPVSPYDMWGWNGVNGITVATP